MPSYRTLAGIAALTCAVAGCANDPGSEEVCDSGPSAVAAFNVTLVAPAARLPPDTLVRVQHGSGTEEWRYSDATHPTRVVFCETRDVTDAGVVDASAAGDGGAANALECELWTGGSATLWATATGYEPIEKELSAEKGACGLRTVPVELEFVLEGDGGS